MRIVLSTEYSGTHYHGWQKQHGLVTIQGTLENALSKVANHTINVVCAGRTDVGVHALQQIIHFDTEANRKLDAWVLGVNSNLPPDIRVNSAQLVSDTFHARFSAIARRYRYIIYNHNVRPALYHNLVAWYINPLNANLMQEAAQYLIGEHDFSSFRSCDCQSKSPMRNVHAIKIQRKNKLVIIDIKANAFLQHMVRNIAGLLMAIGQGAYKPLWAQEVLKSCNRRVAAKTASASGLYLAKVYY
jgi:tRNA pseudouridine38-40 synthase